MKFEDWFNIESKNPPPGFDRIIASSSHFLSIYVIFCLLFNIKKYLGLECMLEYIRKYIEKYARAYPQKKVIVDKEISRIDIAAMYKKAMF